MTKNKDQTKMTGKSAHKKSAEYLRKVAKGQKRVARSRHRKGKSMYSLCSSLRCKKPGLKRPMQSVI